MSRLGARASARRLCGGKHIKLNRCMCTLRGLFAKSAMGGVDFPKQERLTNLLENHYVAHECLCSFCTFSHVCRPFVAPLLGHVQFFWSHSFWSFFLFTNIKDNIMVLCSPISAHFHFSLPALGQLEGGCRSASRAPGSEVQPPSELRCSPPEELADPSRDLTILHTTQL